MSDDKVSDYYVGQKQQVLGEVGPSVFFIFAYIKSINSGPGYILFLKIICDNDMTLWVDGEKQDLLLDLDGQMSWKAMSILNISSATEVLGVKCVNSWGGHYGIMGDVTDEAGKEILVTDSSWNCSNTADEGWERADFLEGGNWSPAFYNKKHEPYLNSSNSLPWASMSPNRKVIWTDSDKDTIVYCRRMLRMAGIESSKYLNVQIKENHTACTRTLYLFRSRSYI